MSLQSEPYKVGQKVKWGFDSCYRCVGLDWTTPTVWCGHSVVDWFIKEVEVLEVKWGEVQVTAAGEFKPDWIYTVEVEKWNNEVYREEVPHWRLERAQT